MHRTENELWQESGVATSVPMEVTISNMSTVSVMERCSHPTTGDHPRSVRTTSCTATATQRTKSQLLLIPYKSEVVWSKQNVIQSHNLSISTCQVAHANHSLLLDKDSTFASKTAALVVGICSCFGLDAIDDLVSRVIQLTS